jgi:hypothetical protein
MLKIFKIWTVYFNLKPLSTMPDVRLKPRGRGMERGFILVKY